MVVVLGAKTSMVALLFLGLACLMLGGCHKPDDASPPKHPVANDAADASGKRHPDAASKPPNSVGALPPIPEPSATEPEDPDRWLHVLAVKKGVDGGWATGSFHEERNMLEIRTKDVTGFAVDIDRIEIDWTRPVVLSINSRRSELKRRESARYHFVRQRNGGWAVMEPPVND